MENFFSNHQAEQHPISLGLLHPADMKGLQKPIINLLANQVCQFLHQHCDHMLQFSPAEIISFMQDGDAVIMVNGGMEVVGFAKNYEWKDKNTGEHVIEFGSWMSTKEGKGNGHKLAYAAMKAAHVKYGNETPIFAVIDAHNKRSIHILEELGGYEDAPPPILGVETEEWGTRQSVILNLSNIGLQPDH